MRTSVMEEKATACNMLCCYADELKEGFYPYVEQVQSCSLSSTLWQASISCCTLLQLALLKACVLLTCHVYALV